MIRQENGYLAIAYFSRSLTGGWDRGLGHGQKYASRRTGMLLRRLLVW